MKSLSELTKEDREQLNAAYAAYFETQERETALLAQCLTKQPRKVLTNVYRLVVD